jgi:hypothetical protein
MVNLLRLKLPGVALCFLLLCADAFAERLLMTLQLDSSTIQWQDEFVLRLEIYGPPMDQAPQVAIDGLDQFKLRGQGTNLFQVPNGKTVKWVLTYNLTATQEGTFKLGPAVTTFNKERTTSNILFVNVEGGAIEKTKKEPEVPIPLVHSAAEVGNKVLIRMVSNKVKVTRTEGVVVNLQLLSQLPVENLRYTQEPDFPGFLKYDFPFTAHPKAAVVQYNGAKYASYELQKFLLFPLNVGKVPIPAVGCELDVRVPSGAYIAADLMLRIPRSSNVIPLSAAAVPGEDTRLVGDFSLRTRMAADQPRSKVINFVLQGFGELSTFDFPDVAVDGGQAHEVITSTSAEIQGERLASTRTISVEITPESGATRAVVHELRIHQFNPETKRISLLELPALPLQFWPTPTPPKPPAMAIPQLTDQTGWILFATVCALSFASLALSFRKMPRKQRLRLHPLFHRKRSELQISRKAAQGLYRQILSRISEQDGEDVSLTGILKRHLPERQWFQADAAFRKLEWNAFSPAPAVPLTYTEMKTICEAVEKRWR